MFTSAGDAKKEFDLSGRSSDLRAPSPHRPEGNAEMLCTEVKRVVYFFLDGSLGSRSLSEFNSHLGLCHECEARLHIQKQLRQFVRARLAPLNAPERLKLRLTRTLRAFDGAD